MIEYTISTTSSGTTEWLRMDSSDGAGAGYTLLVTSSGTATYDVEFAVEKDLDSATAIQHDTLKAQTADAASIESTPATAFRLNVTSYTSGTVTLSILQGGNG